MYVNSGLFFLEAGDLQLAEVLLSAGCWLAFWAPHAWANRAAMPMGKSPNGIQ